MVSAQPRMQVSCGQHAVNRKRKDLSRPDVLQVEHEALEKRGMARTCSYGRVCTRWQNHLLARPNIANSVGIIWRVSLASASWFCVVLLACAKLYMLV